MKKILGTILGFEWVQNVMVKNAARAGAVALIALSIKTPWVGDILASFGLTSESITTGLIASGIAILGAIRGWTKPKPDAVPVDRIPQD